MCGRYALATSNKQLKETFDAVLEQQGTGSGRGETENPILTDRYNIAPSQIVAAVRQFEDERVISGLKWGLVPSWAKDPHIGNNMINARAETVAEKPSFKSAFKSRRCIIPASGFYEWVHPGSKSSGGAGKGAKQPFYFYLTGQPVFGFAALWEAWTDKETGAALDTCTIITTTANARLAPVHDRMPVILKPADYEE